MGDPVISAWAFTPARLTDFLQGEGSFQAVLTLFTAIFMHGGLGHIAGTLLFLWAFGQIAGIIGAYLAWWKTVVYVTCCSMALRRLLKRKHSGRSR